MTDSKDLVAIPWKQCRLQDVASFPALGGTCYVVMSEQYFGWRPSTIPFNHPLFFPGKYFVVPITAIRCAGFKGNWIEKSVYMTTDLEEVIEGEIGYPHAWLTAFDVLGIPVANRQLASLKTVKGFLATYQDLVWFLAIGPLFLICLIVAARMKTQLALPIVILVAPVVLWYLSLLVRILIKKSLAGGELKDKT